MFGARTFETLAVSTIFVFRIRRPEAERPYRCPGYPWVPMVYVAILALVVCILAIIAILETAGRKGNGGGPG